MAGSANRRTSAQSASDMPPWKSTDVAYAGWWGPRTQAGSPVMCTSEHRRAGMLTSASEAAIAASSSENGWPAYGFGHSGKHATTRRRVTALLAPARCEGPRQHLNLNLNLNLNLIVNFQLNFR